MSGYVKRKGLRKVNRPNKHGPRKKNLKRAEKAKLAKQFKVGDRITWGIGSIDHTIVAVQNDGVLVDVTGEPYADIFATKRTDVGRLLLFVAFDGNNRSRSGRGPIRFATDEDKALRQELRQGRTKL